jgi:hypothetical protein
MRCSTFVGAIVVGVVMLTPGPASGGECTTSQSEMDRDAVEARLRLIAREYGAADPDAVPQDERAWFKPAHARALVGFVVDETGDLDIRTLAMILLYRTGTGPDEVAILSDFIVRTKLKRTAIPPKAMPELWNQLRVYFAESFWTTRDESFLKPFRAALDQRDCDWACRQSAVSQLAESGSRADIPRFLSMMADTRLRDAERLYAAGGIAFADDARSLGYLRAVGENFFDTSVAESRGSNAQFAVRAIAHLAITEPRANEVLQELILRSCSDEAKTSVYERVHYWMVEELEGVGGTGNARFLERLLKGSCTNDRVARTAVLVLGKIGDEESKGYLETLRGRYPVEVSKAFTEMQRRVVTQPQKR